MWDSCDEIAVVKMWVMKYFPLTNYKLEYDLKVQIVFSLSKRKKSMDQNLIKHCKETLRRNNLQPIKKLGQGSFGIVFLVSKPTIESEFYSVKCTSKKQFLKKPLLRRYLKREILLMKELQHQNIVKLIQNFQDDGWIFMLMEYCDVGSLSSIQTQKKQGVFSFQQCSFIIKEIICGLSYMHQNNILHRDIKPENILQKRTKKGPITKICDLGFSRQANSEVNTFCGTTYYMAPQIFQKKQYDIKVDIWAIGVLIYTMLFSYVPFKGINMQSEIISKCEGGFDLTKRKRKINSSIDKDKMKLLTTIFKGIFQINPQKRWSLDEISDALTIYPISKKIKTAETDNTEGNSLEDDFFNENSFELDQVWFIQNVLDEVHKIQFLTPMEEQYLKFYLDKACLSILDQNKESKKHPKEINMIEKLKENQKKEIQLFLKSLNDCEIPKFKDAYREKYSIKFEDYKEQYRIVVGHAFYKAHKSIKKVQTKMRIKLKLFCCHVINRIFQSSHRKDLFSHYFAWRAKSDQLSTFEMKHFNDWINEDNVQNINGTIQTINKKFYRK